MEQGQTFWMTENNHERSAASMKQTNNHRTTDAEQLRVIHCAKTYREKYAAVGRLQGQDSIRRVALDNGLSWKVRKAAVCRLEDRETLEYIAARDRRDYLRNMAARRLTGAKHPERTAMRGRRPGIYQPEPVSFDIFHSYDRFEYPFGCSLVWWHNVELRVKSRRFVFWIDEKYDVHTEFVQPMLQGLANEGRFLVTLGNLSICGERVELPLPRLRIRVKLQEMTSERDLREKTFEAICREADFVAAVERGLD